MKLRWRMVLALAIAGLLPLFPLLWSVRSAVKVGASTLAPPQIGETLRDGVNMARAELVQRQEDAERRLSMISRLAPIPPQQVESSLYHTYLKPGERLYLNLDGRWWQLSSEGWIGTTEPRDQATGDFDQIPRQVEASVMIGNQRWHLVSPLDPQFLEHAASLQQASADWALRSFERDRLIGSLVGTYLITYLVAVLLAVGASMVVIVPATRGIEQLTDVAEQVRAGQEDRRAEVRHGGEIGRLATTFNLMLNRLDESRHKAAEMEKMAAWRELARVLAHEIKNPLTPIQLSVQQLSDSYDGDDERFKRLVATTREIVDEEIESLRRLTREFSDFARAPQLRPENCSLQHLIHDLAALYGNRLEMIVNTEHDDIAWDREKVKRALINLVDNALAAAGDDGTVRMTVDRDADWCVISVEDNGPGVDEDKRATIFEPYFTTKRTGVGLGLPLVRTTCEQHGGSIQVDRSPDLGGARFIARLPDRVPEETA